MNFFFKKNKKILLLFSCYFVCFLTFFVNFFSIFLLLSCYFFYFFYFFILFTFLLVFFLIFFYFHFFSSSPTFFFNFTFYFLFFWFSKLFFTFNLRLFALFFTFSPFHFLLFYLLNIFFLFISKKIFISSEKNLIFGIFLFLFFFFLENFFVFKHFFAPPNPFTTFHPFFVLYFRFFHKKHFGPNKYFCFCFWACMFYFFFSFLVFFKKIFTLPPLSLLPVLLFLPDLLCSFLLIFSFFSLTLFLVLYPPLCNCPCSIDHVVVDWSCWKLLHRPSDRVRFTARTRAFLLSTCSPDTRRHTSTRARYLRLRAVYLWRTKRLSKSVGRDCQWRRRLPLWHNCRFRAIGVCTCATLCCSQRGVSREILVATEWKPECGVAWSRSVTIGDTTRSFSTQDRGKFARLRRAGAPRYGGVGWRRDDKRSAASVGYSYRVSECRGEVVVPLGRWRVAHPSGSCTVVLVEIAADLEDQLDIISEVPEGSIRFSPDVRQPHTPSLVRTAAWDERYSGVDEGCVLPTPGSAEEEHASFKSPSGEGAGCEEGSEAPTTKRDRGPASEASVPSRIPGNSALTWKISVAGWPPSKSVELLPSRPCAVQALRCWKCLPLRARQAAQRYTRLALCVEQAHGPATLVFSIQKTICLLANLSTFPKYLQSWQQFWTSQKLALTRGRVRSGSGCGNFRNGVHRSSQRWQIRRERLQRLGGRAQVHRIPHIRHEYSGVITVAHETRVREDLMTLPKESWSWHCFFFFQKKKKARTKRHVMPAARCSWGFRNRQSERQLEVDCVPRGAASFELVCEPKAGFSMAIGHGFPRCAAAADQTFRKSRRLLCFLFGSQSFMQRLADTFSLSLPKKTTVSGHKVKENISIKMATVYVSPWPWPRVSSMCSGGGSNISEKSAFSLLLFGSQSMQQLADMFSLS